MSFTNPWALLLLLCLPVIILIWRSSTAPAQPAAPALAPKSAGKRRIETAELSLAVRLLLLGCLILALAGLRIKTDWQSGSTVAAVFLLDRSDSISLADQAAQLAYLNQALQQMGPDDQAAIIVFGGDALIERSMSGKAAYLQPILSLAAQPERSQTNLAAAIQLGLALYPHGSTRRMLLLSDGQQTLGDGEAAATLAGANQVELLVPVWQNPTTAGTAEVLLSALNAPPALRQGDRFSLSIEIEASQATSATLQIFSGGELLQTGRVALQPGLQTFSLPLTAEQSGFAAYRAVISPDNDHLSQNNQAFAYTQVSGEAKILLAAPPTTEALGSQGQLRGDETSRLRQVLEQAGFGVQQVLPAGIPGELPALAEYAAIVLVDVPAPQLSNRQMSALQSYVRDLGGGLVVIGGPTSFGVGGYYQTPLEETLPVEMQIKDEIRRPKLGLVFIIDHSGSMAETSGGPTKVDLAKEAIIRSLDLLMPTDRVGVVAFDDSAAWVVELAELSDPAAVKAKVGGIRADGGTDILAGLQAMAKVFPNDPATTKHVILLTDGGANPSGIPELVQQLYEEEGITLSTIGVGNDAAAFLPQLAAVGGGRYHFAANPASIPSIYAEETSLATRAYIVEETFAPVITSPASPLLKNLTGLPNLLGYVATSARPEAETILQSHKEDPLLASWQYGLGHAIAFTSDATGRWAQNWLNWPGYDTFWIQVIRSVVGIPLGSELNATVTPENGAALLTVDLPQSTAGSIRTRILQPSGDTEEIVLDKIAPGRYQNRFNPDATGVYLISLQDEVTGSSQVYGWARSYSPEYARSESDPNALLRLAVAAGGDFGNLSPSLAFAPTQDNSSFWQSLFRDSGETQTPIWPWLLTAAACLLPLDIALRRLALPPMTEWRTILQQTWRNGLTSLRTVWKRPAPATVGEARIERLTKKIRPAGQPKISTPSSQSPEAGKTLPPLPPPPHEPRRGAMDKKVEDAPKDENLTDKQLKENSTAAALLANKRRRQK